MKKLVLIHILFGLVTSLQAQITLIPDPYFEGVLVGFGIDTDGEVNGQALTSDLEAVTQLLIYDQQLIADVTGIEAFINLEKLELTNMGITHLDLSNAVLLEELEVGNNSLLELDLSNNINLKNLLIQLNCSSCQFYSPLSNLDLSNNLVLRDVYLLDASITYLDFSNNSNLVRLQLSRLNDLTQVNLKNGANSSLYYLRFLQNESLTCVQVDDPEAVIAGVDPPYDNWVIENNPIISEDCFLGLEDYGQKGVVLYPNPVKDVLSIESATHIKKVKIYNLFGLLVKEVTANFRAISLAELPTGLLVVEKIVKE